MSNKAKETDEEQDEDFVQPSAQNAEETPDGFTRATLRSTYYHEGIGYGPGIDINVPQALADLVDVDLPIDQSGYDGEITLRSEHKALNDGEDVSKVQGPGTEAEKRAALKRAREDSPERGLKDDAGETVKTEKPGTKHTTAKKGGRRK